MPLDPRLQPLVDGAAQGAPAQGLGVDELRQRAHGAMDLMFSALSDAGPEMASVEDHVVPVHGGEITVRAYTPEGEAPLPVHVYFHGGGFWLGTLDQFDGECRATAQAAHCVAVSVDYRLAPEHHYPTAPEDCYTALRWVVDHADLLGIDPARTSVGGASAGGNLAAVVALMARDRGGPSLVCQVLSIPVTDLTMSQPSVQENGTGYVLTADSMRQYRDFYLADESEATLPYASPIFADLADLPPALVMTAEYDPLRDEGEAYGKKLQAAGVPTVIRRWEGQIHGSQGLSKLIPDAAKEYHELVASTLQRAYGSSGT